VNRRFGIEKSSGIFDNGALKTLVMTKGKAQDSCPVGTHLLLLAVFFTAWWARAQALHHNLFPQSFPTKALSGAARSRLFLPDSSSCRGSSESCSNQIVAFTSGAFQAATCQMPSNSKQR